MKIIIDARLYSQSGVGRYLQQLISHLAEIDQKTNYLIFLNKDDFFQFKSPGKNFEKKLVDIPWHSLKEQFVLPFLLLKERPNLVHFPYFSAPIFCPGKFVVTIHDLIIDHFATGRASTHSGWFYQLKRWFYRLVIKIGLKRARKIITVSRATRKEIISHYRVNPEKITVTYEAA